MPSPPSITEAMSNAATFNELHHIMKRDINDIITDRLIAALESGTAPWRKPWRGGASTPRNMKSGKAYRGINTLLLGCQGWADPNWLTFRQAKERGGQVRKGEKATPVIFWKWLFKDENGKPVSDPKAASKRIPLLRYYSVFNVEQCDGVETNWEAPPLADHEPIENAQKIIEGMPNAPKTTHNEARAYYSPVEDRVNLPKLGLFNSPEEYYSTAFHELAHATGHKSRLDRDGVTGTHSFGSADYSKEELVAEMAAAMLCGHAGCETATLANSANYLASWIKVLKGDNTLAIKAGGQAQKAVDYILDVKWD